MLQPDEIIRSSRKTLSISVDARGRLIVRAPKRYAEERIFAFLEEKRAWIEKQRALRQRVAIPLPEESLEGYAFPLLGRSTQIVLTDEKRVRYDGENHRLYLPKDKPKERLAQWLKENARRILTAVTEEYAQKMGVKYTSLAVTSAKTRWGSCSAKDGLRYTFRLLYCPKEVVEYVVVHELAHIRHKNHSKAFWQEVATYLPDWKEKRAYLKARGVYMELF